jgi:HK97 family phage major capsid protein
MNDKPFTWDDEDRWQELAQYAHRSQPQQAEFAGLDARRERVMKAMRSRSASRAAEGVAGYGESVAASAGYGRGATRAWPAGQVGAMMSDHPRMLVSRARRTIDRLHDHSEIPASGAGRLEDMLRVPFEREQSLAASEAEVERLRSAELICTLGSEDYAAAFRAVLGDPQHGHLYLSDRERDALARARALAVGAGATGGFAVPLQLDPGILLTSDGTANPMRKIIRTVTGTAKELDLVTSAGVTTSWVAEGTEATDASPTLAQPVIRPLRQQSFIPFSMELDLTWSAMRTEMQRLLTDAADIADAVGFTTGAGGTISPQGVVPALVGTGSEVTTAGTAALSLGDLMTCQASVPPRFRGPRTSWIASLPIINTARQFQIVTGVSAVQGSGGAQSLLNDPLAENSHMDTSVATGKHVAISGDFYTGYCAYERLPAVVELVQHLFGPANRYPTGQRGLFMVRMVGGQVVAPQALRLLTVR